MTAPPPYIGLSGLVSRTEVEAAIAAFPDCGRQLMVGGLVSEKTLAGQRNKWWRRYPPVDRIAGVFVDDPRCLNMVHYSSDDPPDQDTLLRLVGISGHLCHGFQFNGAWPRVSDLGALLRSFARIAGRSPRIVLQVGPRMLQERPTPRDVAFQLWVYEGMFSDVLIDASGGTGNAINASRAARFVEYLRHDLANVGITVAGGLCAETIPEVAHLIRDGVSIDAEGRLRDGADGGGRLAQEKVNAYLRAAAEAVSP